MSEAPSEAFGPYLVYEQLGIGGMAQVHRAEVAGSEGFHRPIALKRMLPHVAANVDMVKSFVREAHLASHLHHANVAQTYELGKVDDIYFIAMELIVGRNLREILRHCAATTGPMPVPVALNIINQICDALDYAHNLCDERGKPLGIIHRDVSPSNVIVAEGGVVKLIDFGIAKVTSAAMQTMSGTVKGKFGYMAPEYLEGRIDARADLFAVGVIAHELLTNHPLFTTPDDMETLRRVRGMELAPPSHQNPNVPAAVDDIVMTALARDPDRRWQHATALKNAMTTVTARLGLVISNAKVLEWIDWAFDQTKPQVASLRTIRIEEHDPSIVISSEPSSVVATTIAPAPLGTPQRITAQQADADADQRRNAPTASRMSAPQMTLAGTAPIPRRNPPPASSPPYAPRTITPDRVSPPTIEPAPRAPAPDLLPAPPALPARGSPGPQLGHRVDLPTTTRPPPSQASRGMTVVLVLLAAVIAAAAVYFLLPLVT